MYKHLITIYFIFLKPQLVFISLLLFTCNLTFSQNKKQNDDFLTQLLATKAFEKTVTKALNADAPLELDQDKALPQYTGAVNNFNPVMLKSISDLDRPLSPGDYSVDVIFYCTQWSIHRPGAGLPYKLGRAQGRLAKQMTALLFRGTLKHINAHTLNAMAWRIQGGVQLQKWSAAEQKLVHELIPEYEKDLKGDYVQQFEDYYSKLVAPITKKTFDVQMTSMGDIGKTVMNLRKSRQLLADKNIAQDKLPERLYDQNNDGTPMQLPPTKDKPSPWMTVQEGVIARFTVQQGNYGHNLLEFRVLENSGNSLKRSKGGGFFNEESLVADNVQTASLNKIVNGTGKVEGQGMVAYPVLQGAQIPFLGISLDDDFACPDLDEKYDLVSQLGDNSSGQIPYCINTTCLTKFTTSGAVKDGGLWFEGSDKKGHYYLAINPLGKFYMGPAEAMEILKNNIGEIFPGGAVDQNRGSTKSNTKVSNGHIYELGLLKFQVKAIELSNFHFTFETIKYHPLVGTAAHGIFKDSCGNLYMFQQGRGDGSTWDTVSNTAISLFGKNRDMWKEMSQNASKFLHKNDIYK